MPGREMVALWAKQALVRVTKGNSSTDRREAGGWGCHRRGKREIHVFISQIFIERWHHVRYSARGGCVSWWTCQLLGVGLRGFWGFRPKPASVVAQEPTWSWRRDSAWSVLCVFTVVNNFDLFTWYPSSQPARYQVGSQPPSPDGLRGAQHR